LRFIKNSCCKIFDIEHPICSAVENVYENYYHFIEFQWFPSNFTSLEGLKQWPWPDCDECTKEKIRYEKEKMIERDNYDFRKILCENILDNNLVWNTTDFLNRINGKR